jgi:DNA replication protein DnaC
VAETLLTAHADVVRARAPQVHYSARILYQELRASRGYTGRYETVKRFVAPLREVQLQADRALMRFETPPGQQSQIDWGQATVPFRAGPTVVHVFVLTLGFSRRGFYHACADERMAQFLEAHERAFAHFGGHSREPLDDRPRTVCHADETGRRLWHPTLVAKHITMRTCLARLPFVNSLEAFDCADQPSLEKTPLQQVATCHVIEQGEHRVLVGPPGVGKSHLAIGLGPKAIERGYRVWCTTAAAMIATLTRALAENRLEDKLNLYTIPRWLIIDEIGDLPIDRTGAKLFFQLISRRYEKGPMIVTSHQSFGAWGEVFGDRVLATAILDRVLHHAITMNIRGHSYRLKEKLKAGLVRRDEAAATT